MTLIAVDGDSAFLLDDEVAAPIIQQTADTTSGSRARILVGFLACSLATVAVCMRGGMPWSVQMASFNGEPDTIQKQEVSHPTRCNDLTPNGEACCQDKMPGGVVWHDSDGHFYHCEWYSAKNRCQRHGTRLENLGETASTACCACGGGELGGAPVILETEDSVAVILETEDSVAVYLAGIKNMEAETKEDKRVWLREKMDGVRSIKTIKALHMYYRIASKEELMGGPYEDVAEGERARLTVEWGLHKYDGDDWHEYMNEEIASRKPPEGAQAGVGTTASLVKQVFPPDERFVILILAWLPVGKYPWVGTGGVGAAHTHGQATCNFKFLNVVEGAGNTFYDLNDGASTVTDMYQDGLPHKGGCNDHDYRPVLLKPGAGREFIPSEDLVGPTSGYIQDDLGAHSIDNMNSSHIAFSIHVYYPPYARAWAFHAGADKESQSCDPRYGETPHGKHNCEQTIKEECGTTSMKKYLELAADFKEQHGDDHPVSWYHDMCARDHDCLEDKGLEAIDVIDDTLEA